jgi:soluble lytic murein transglycosylase-like protein
MICMRLAVATALCAGSLLPPVATAATVGRVFVSYAVDGSPRYASQRLDASYRVFIRGETVRTKSGKAPSTRSHVSQEQGRRQLTPLIAHFAHLHQVEPELVAAVVAVESGFNTAAVSPAGAVGAMQLMPATAARYGVTNAANPAQNIDAGVRHLKDLLHLHGGNVALALAAYNAGQGAVARNGGRIPPYRETMLYVPAVLAAAARGGGL